MPHPSRAGRTPRRSGRGSWTALLLLAVLAGLPFPSRASPPREPWDAPAFTADPVAMAREAARIAAGEDGVAVLLAETRYEYDEAGRETYTYRLVYRIASATAHESWSTIEESWSPWHQERPRLRARVITPDGAVHALDPATIAENGEAASSPEMFEDGRLLRAPLPATGPGAVVEQEVMVRETVPFFAGGTVRVRPLSMPVPVRLSRTLVEAPAEAPLRWTTRLLPGVTPREETAGGRRRLTFEARDLPAFALPEPGLPPEAPRFAYVAFSTGRSWADVARRYSAIVDTAIRGADLQAFLRAAGVPAASQMETIERLLARISQEIRYTGIELGEGGLIPRTPAETLRRKFGDCKDKAVLLTALLRASDIPAYVALLNAGEGGPDVEEALPGLGGFNHAIVVVPGNPAVWIDPTDPYARAGELPVDDQGRLALIASPTAAGLVRTPEAAAADNRELETRELYLADFGPARVVETTRYWGAAERALRAYYASLETEAARQGLEQYAASAYRGGILTSFDHSKPEDLSQPFRLHLEAAEIGRGITDVAAAAVAVFPSALLDRLPDDLLPSGDEEEEEKDGGEAEARKADYVFTRPFQSETRYRVVPPAGFVPQPLPASRTRQLGPVTLSEEYKEEADGVVTAVLRLDVGKRRISPAELDALRQGIREVQEDKPVLILYEQAGESHLAAGRVREALQELQRLAALAPGKALPRTRSARALLAGGMGEAARREAGEAVKLEPGLALAQRTLGWILQHDAIGRRFGKGWDRKGAIAAYRKAKELDPDDQIARADLAILLEHDVRGDRYTAGADLAAAIDEYRALRADLESADMDQNLAVALLRAGRFQELRDFLGEIEETEERKVLRLVATAALESPDAAVREAERRFPAGESRLTALANAAQNLTILRRYSDAAALLEGASRQSPNAAAVLAQVEVLRKARRSEELKPSMKEPSGAVRQLFHLFAADSIEPKSFASLFLHGTEALASGEEEEAFRRLVNAEFGTMRKKLRAGEIPVEAALDLVFAVFQENVTGDAAVGYRVKLSTSVVQGAQEMTVFTVPDQGEYRILAMDDGLVDLGKQALRCLQRGDLRAARQWLDWAHEEAEGDYDDPYLNPAVLTLWQRGQEGEAGEIRCAAATLLAEGAEVDNETLATLRSCRESAGSDEGKRALDFALADAAMSRELYPDLLEIVRLLNAAAPDSTMGYWAEATALRELGRWDELRQVAEQRLKSHPDDLEPLRTFAFLEHRKGDFAGEAGALQRIVDTGKAKASDYNELAWLALVLNRVDDKAFDYAQRATTLSAYGDYNSLHTLASLYAEQGKTAEAYRLFLQAFETRDDQELDGSDLYLLGRLAEQYGLPDVARDYYQRVKWPGDGPHDPTSSYELAHRRLAALGKTQEGKQAKK